MNTGSKKEYHSYVLFQKTPCELQNYKSFINGICVGSLPVFILLKKLTIKPVFANLP